MKKKFSKIMSLILAGTMIIGLAGCGGAGNDKGVDGGSVISKSEAKKYVYKLEEIKTDFLGENASISASCYRDGKINIVAVENYYNEQTGILINLVSINEDGTDPQVKELYNDLRENPYYQPYDPGMDTPTIEEKDTVLPMDDVPSPTDDIDNVNTDDVNTVDDTQDSEINTEEQCDVYVSSSMMDQNGIYIVMEANNYKYDNDGNYNSLGSTLTLYQYDYNGKQKNEVVISANQDEEYVYVNNLLSDDKGNLLAVTGNKILIFDQSGNKQNEIPLDGQDMNVQFCFMSKDGKLNMTCYNQDWTKLTLKVYNLQSKAFEADKELLDTIGNYGMSAGVDYDLFLTNASGAYGYNIGDAEVTPILSYINSDLNSNNMNTLTVVDDKHILAVYTDDEDGYKSWNQKIGLLTYVDPADIPDKEVISLACYYLGYDMRKRIVDFNKTSDKYRIAVKDYSNYATSDDYNAGYTQLNSDILAGQIPDILVIDSDNMPVESYIAKGILADIGKLIDEDTELNKDDFMTNVFDAYSVNGKLYSIIPSFYISTVMGKTSIVGDKPGWTIDDMNELMKKYPDSSVFEDSMTQETILWYVMMYNGARFVDAASGKCQFDTKEFQDLLAFIKQFPESYNWDEDYDYSKYQTQYRDNSVLLNTSGISDFNDYLYTTKGYFGELVTMIGFPCEDGIGAVVRANTEYAISAKSKNIDGAWNFLKYYLTDEYQSSDEMNWCLPITKKALKQKLEDAKERPYWTYDDGTKEYYDNMFYIGDQEILIEPMTDEEADAIYEYIGSVTQKYYYDDNLSNIIKEEAAAYFKGQKSAEEVTKIIQSRAQVYINESR